MSGNPGTRPVPADLGVVRVLYKPFSLIDLGNLVGKVLVRTKAEG
jgi:hypothetical protein